MNAIPLPLTRIGEIISRLDYFQGLALETRRLLATNARHTRVHRDEAVFHKGTPANILHIVVSGQIKVFLRQPNGGEKVVALVEHGDSFGVASLWLGEMHLADAVANKDSHLLTLDRHLLLKAASQDFKLTSRLMDAVSRRVMDLMRNLESCAPRSAQQRVACYLVQRSPLGNDTRYEVFLPTTKREVATKLNLTQETFSRVLRQLAAQGIIEVNGRSIQILDALQLKALNALEPAVQNDNPTNSLDLVDQE